MRAGPRGRPGRGAGVPADRVDRRVHRGLRGGGARGGRVRAVPGAGPRAGRHRAGRVWRSPCWWCPRCWPCSGGWVFWPSRMPAEPVDPGSVAGPAEVGGPVPRSRMIAFLADRRRAAMAAAAVTLVLALAATPLLAARSRGGPDRVAARRQPGPGGHRGGGRRVRTGHPVADRGDRLRAGIADRRPALSALDAALQRRSCGTRARRCRTPRAGAQLVAGIDVKASELHDSSPATSGRLGVQFIRSGPGRPPGATRDADAGVLPGALALRAVLPG